MTEQATKIESLHFPLSELTRKKRRVLLGVSIAGIAIVKLKIIPKISWLGIDFPEVPSQLLLPLLSLIVLYFLFGFVIYAGSDFVAWRQAINKQRLDVVTRIDRFLRQRRKLNESRKETELPYDNENLNEGDNAGDLLRMYRDIQSRLSWLNIQVAVARDLFEIALPIVVSLYSMYLLWFL